MKKDEGITTENDTQIAAKESLEEVDLGTNPQEPRPIHKMPGLDPGLMVHTLNVDLEVKPVAQPTRVFHTKIKE